MSGLPCCMASALRGPDACTCTPRTPVDTREGWTEADFAAADLAAVQADIDAERASEAIPNDVRDAGPRCACEHSDHFDGGPGHNYRDALAGGHFALFVGPICDPCAEGHLAEYVRPW